VLAQESIAGMDGVDIRDLGRADDGGDVQIAARALGGPDANGLVGETRMQAVTVGFRIDRDSADAEFLARANDPPGDFAAIRDEDLPKRCGWQTAPPRTPPAGRSSRACSPPLPRLRTRFRSSISSTR